MSKVNRNAPKRSTASESQYSLMEFTREFPDDAACLEHLWRSRFSPDGSHADCPVCKRERKFHKVASRPSWSCDSCGKHIHPTAGTVFHKSATSLQLWFYVMYVMTSTRCGVSAKAIEREIGVGYKTAWRMCNRIRNHLMEQDDYKLGGKVEVDESAYGGKRQRPSGCWSRFFGPPLATSCPSGSRQSRVGRFEEPDLALLVRLLLGVTIRDSPADASTCLTSRLLMGALPSARIS